MSVYDDEDLDELEPPVLDRLIVAPEVARVFQISDFQYDLDSITVRARNVTERPEIFRAMIATIAYPR